MKGLLYFSTFSFRGMPVLMLCFRDLSELFKEFEHDLEEVNTKMAILKERNKKKENENNEEFHLQQDMSLLPGTNLFIFIFRNELFVRLISDSFLFGFRFTYF